MIILIFLETIIIVGTILNIIDIIGDKMTDLVEWIIDTIERWIRKRGRYD